MRQDVGIDGDAQRIGQLVRVLFLKILDDKEQEFELLRDRYRSPIPAKLRWRNWAADPEGMMADDLLNFCNNDLFPALKELPALGPDQLAFVMRSVFEDAYQYMKSGTTERFAIEGRLPVVESLGGSVWRVSRSRSGRRHRGLAGPARRNSAGDPGVEASEWNHRADPVLDRLAREAPASVHRSASPATGAKGTG